MNLVSNMTVVLYNDSTFVTEYEHLKKYVMWTRQRKANDVVQMSFIYSPSLTCLDLSTSELTTKSKFINTWEKFRRFLDKRKEIIYKFDLEDKFVQPPRYYPNYFELHELDKPEEYKFPELNTLHEGIEDYTKSSRDVVSTIRRLLPPVKKLGSWIGLFQLKYIYASFLKTLIENNTEDIPLIRILLDYTRGFSLWRYFEPHHMEQICSAIQVFNLSDTEWPHKGRCGVFLDLFGSDISKVEAFLLNGFYPLNDYGITLYQLPRTEYEYLFNHVHKRFILMCLSLNHRMLVRDDVFNELTNIDILCMVALYVYRHQKNRELLVMIWRTITNVFLKLEDFLQLFRKLSNAETKELNIIYNWYKTVVETDVEKNSGTRKLRHLCRCVIRQRLVKTMLLSEGIDALGLPTKIDSFIKLNS